ncbi:YheT family hydrolase [Microcoleus sp. FACHB-672]|uniref:YheT family hydrolase n=1 Tax=Microcoleus sp. FACHB-672 TaxID=2692825 RepID=UPI0016876FB9|nr:alpha/beta fold hydrolase [Microcoleus sp. FACHB-672]MBD2039136.1 alpha/beta fold hydrolase [Microcoleus sp. FACHB-672]
MTYPPYIPPFLLRNGLAMTIYAARRASLEWEKTTPHPEPPYRETVFSGAGNVPIFGLVAIPDNPHSTIVGTYGITGDLENQWFLKLLRRKAFAQGFAVVLFDWRAHGKTGLLSPTLTSDGLYEGEDFVRIAAQAKAMGCPAPFWFTGFSLGGQLALWAVKASQDLTLCQELGLGSNDIRGGAVICPSLDSNRSLSYLIQHPWGKYLERAIAGELKKLAWQLHEVHPQAIDPAAIERANSIWGFDHELVIERLGFPSVEAYYDASSALPLLPHLNKSTLILYAADDPMFEPAIIPDLQAVCAGNPAIDLILTQYGGHVGYISSKTSQRLAGDPDSWWAWNRVLEWFHQQSQV